MRGHFGAVFLILMGAIALARNLGLLSFDLGTLMHTWWPVIPLLVGLALFKTPNPDGQRSSAPPGSPDTRNE